MQASSDKVLANSPCMSTNNELRCFAPTGHHNLVVSHAYSINHLLRLSREVFESPMVPFNPYNPDGDNGLTTDTSAKVKKSTTNPKYKSIRPQGYPNFAVGRKDNKTACQEKSICS